MVLCCGCPSGYNRYYTVAYCPSLMRGEFMITDYREVVCGLLFKSYYLCRAGI